MKTVLIAEDYEYVREITVEVLKLAGINSIQAVDGEEAVELFLQHKDIIGAVVLDRGMPKINGLKVYCEIRKVNSTLPVIIVSGDITVVADIKCKCEQLMADKHLYLIQKPYKFNVLIDIIKNYLSDEVCE